MSVRVSRPAETHRRFRPGKLKAGLLAVALIGLAGCETAPQDLPELTLKSIIEKPAPGTVELAERALAANRHVDAQKILERVLLAEPRNVKARLVMAELHLAVGAPGSAAEGFARLVEDPEVSAQALQGRGISLMLVGKAQLGYDSLKKAVEQDPGLWRAWNALGYYHDKKRNWTAAYDSYNRALEENPDSAMIYNNRGYSMLMQQRLVESMEDFSRALEIDRDFSLAQDNLRLALAWGGNYVHAMSGTDKADMARILNNVGFVAILRGDYDNAESYLLRAMEVDPAYNETASRNLTYLEQVKNLREVELLGADGEPQAAKAEKTE